MADKQPRSVYTHPSEVSDQIFAKLGIIEGFLDFSHRFQFAENLMDCVSIIKNCENQGMLLNQFYHKPIQATLDSDIIEKLEQIWFVGGYLLTEYAVQNDNKYEKRMEFLFEYPDEVSTDDDIEQLPPLLGMKPKDEISGDTPLIRIGVAVPEKIAYAGCDPSWLSESAKLKYERNGNYYNYFETVGDILNSENWTQDVSRSYYDFTTTLLFRTWKVYGDQVRVMCWKIARELKDSAVTVVSEYSKRKANSLGD